MSLPKRALFTLSEAAARWGCQIADIAEWALSGHLQIMLVIPPTRFGSEVLSDLVAIAPGDIMAMFRRCGTGPREGIVRRARAPERKRLAPHSAAGVRADGHAR